MADAKFIKRKENFICGHCGVRVFGNGYTNHCPKCLWSRHVDVNPGDRAAACGGLMTPAKVTLRKGDYFLTHHCQKCGLEKLNRLSSEDNFDIILQIQKLN